MKDITIYVSEELGIDLESINEANYKELPLNKTEKVLKDNGYNKGEHYKVKGKGIYLKSEQIAMDISDDLAGEYEVTYDDQDDFKLTIFG